MELSYEEYSELMDQLIAEGYDVLEASEMIFDYLEEQNPRPGQNPTVFRPTPGAGSASGQGGRRGSGSSPGGIFSVPRVPSMQQMVQKGRENEKFNQAFGTAANQLLGRPGQRPAPSASARPTPNVVRTSTPVARPTVTASPTTTPPAAGKVAPTSTSAPTTPPATSTAAPSRPSLRSGIEDIRRMQQASQMRQKGITITSDQIKAAQRTRPTSDTVTQAASKPVAFNPSSSPAVDTSKAYTTPAPAGGYGGVTPKPQTSFSLSKPAETKKNQQKINAGMEIKGNELQEQLKTDNYGSHARPDSLFEAYQSIYNQ